jgi:hypothetical protein
MHGRTQQRGQPGGKQMAMLRPKATVDLVAHFIILRFFDLAGCVRRKGTDG